MDPQAVARLAELWESGIAVLASIIKPRPEDAERDWYWPSYITPRPEIIEAVGKKRKTKGLKLNQVTLSEITKIIDTERLKKQIEEGHKTSEFFKTCPQKGVLRIRLPNDYVVKTETGDKKMVEPVDVTVGGTPLELARKEEAEALAKLNADRNPLTAERLAPYRTAVAARIKAEGGSMSTEKYLPKDKNGRLFKLIEEIGELNAALGKAGRWGMESFNPELPPDQRVENWQWILDEMQDVRDALDACEKDVRSFGEGRKQ
jgi:hypothetical protein